MAQKQQNVAPVQVLPAPPPKRSPWPLVAGIVGALVLAGGAFAVGAMFSGKAVSGGGASEAATAGAAESSAKSETPPAEGAAPAATGGSEAGEQSEAEIEKSVDNTKGLGFAAPSEENMVSLGTFTVNLRGAGGGRVLRMSLYLQAKPGQADALSSAQAQLRDAALTLASDYTYDEIEGIEGKTRLREELLVRMNAVLGQSMIDRLYFTEFVVQ
jgi:flagellar basal body-associated protein FliL